MTLGGTFIIKDGIKFDYCVEAAVRSLMGVCDEIVVLDGGSQDGTWELLTKLVPRFKGRWMLERAEWTPSPMGTWLSDLTNKARLMLHTDAHIYVQGDEVLSDEDYFLIRRLADTGRIYTLERLNFWLDHRHLLPPGEKVGSTIVRLAPVSLPCVGDAQGLEHAQGWEKSKAKIYHYGFIRDAQKLAAKARPMQQAFFNTTDPIWEAVEREGLAALGDVAHATAVPQSRLVPYKGSHPAVAGEWLKQHGYE